MIDKGGTILVGLVSLVLLLFFVVGCDERGSITLCEECEQKCSNQQLWNNRGFYNGFSCNMYNTNDGYVVRECLATDIRVVFYNDTNFNITKSELRTTCVEMCKKC